MIPVQAKILDPRLGTTFPLPAYQTEGSAGLDLVACLDDPLTLAPGQTMLISSGMSVYLQDPNWVSLIMPRSGLGHKKGLVMGNLTGVIDADYQGPLMISAWNRGLKPIVIEPGDRIAQLLIVPVAQAQFQWVDSFERQTSRGEGGFGSTGQSATDTNQQK